MRTVVRIAAAALVASAAVALATPPAHADCTTDYVAAHMYEEEFDYVEVNGLAVTVHGDHVAADARRELALLRAYVDCVD